MRRLTVAVESWPIAGAFTISRGSRTEARVVVATVEDGGARGRGECVPYPRYGEAVEGVAATIESLSNAIAGGATRADLQTLLPGGAARNALDCALWDLDAKLAGKRVWELAGIAAPGPATTAYTLSLGDPASMEAAARAASNRPLLKVKLGGAGDAARIAAVRKGAPDATLIADANEAWDEAVFAENLAACRAVGVSLVEQPLPAGADARLADIAGDERGAIRFCADESIHTAADLDQIASRYQAINIKLDKTGGLTAALELKREALTRGLAIMVGCMVGTSLAMAPALLLANGANYVDLDGPLLLARDRDPGLAFEGSVIGELPAALWG
ncbi:dipeptide epimerase [Rhodomicrobium sp. Az07]|uniref:N-acetyl-D-Glu racemase DgcA n=1 Tax=Rhodomicrobium sp. Az07 TaxID=2839034 RepID=UPI001BE6DCB0|nr:N-acetyl-D-Glu racemase DgcA [Rhodomicrobium sp. Az07]MBT3069650.1 dipeptide epimerase [Rhodomicrobium sp. Az07]